MKKLTLVIFLFIGLIGFSQENTEEDSVENCKLRFGAKGGLNISSASIDLDTSNIGGSTYNIKTIFGPQFGVFLEYSINEKLKIQPELLFSRQGFKINYRDGGHVEINDSYKLSYLSIPLNAKYNVYDNIYVEAGMNFSVLLGGKREYDYFYDSSGTQNDFSEEETEDLSGDIINGGDVGLNIGANYEYKDFLFGVRYTFGLIDLKAASHWRNSLNPDKSRNLAISVGYFFM
jgi:hypothetical protein